MYQYQILLVLWCGAVSCPLASNSFAVSYKKKSIKIALIFASGCSLRISLLMSSTHQMLQATRHVNHHGTKNGVCFTHLLAAVPKCVRIQLVSGFQWLHVAADYNRDSRGYSVSGGLGSPRTW